MPVVGLGDGWAHNHAARLTLGSTEAKVLFGDGSARRFTRAAGTTTWKSQRVGDTLAANGSGSLYSDASTGESLRFDAAGLLLSRRQRNGWTTAYGYAQARLSRITNQFGSAMLLNYGANGSLSSISTPDGKTVQYTYDNANRLSSVGFPDGTSRTYLYENTVFPQALTGIIDESRNRFASFTYDTSGRATVTEHADGTNRYQISYPSMGSTLSADVMYPLGAVASFSYKQQAGRLAVTWRSQRIAGEPSDTASRQQGADGLIASESDIAGVKTAYTWDTARGLPLTITKAAGKPEEQAATIRWHASLPVPELVTQPGLLVAYTYDAMGNPLSETTTDTASKRTRSRKWTYNAQGLVATETGANGAATSYTYDPAGNLASTRNALGHETRYTYDAAGRLLQETEPTGAVTKYTYDARGRLLTHSRDGLTTTLSYAPTGQPSTMAMPDGRVYRFSYDRAQRLVAVVDAQGNSINYTLDSAGNRTATQVKDAAGGLASKTQQEFDLLGYLRALTGPQ